MRTEGLRLLAFILTAVVACERKIDDRQRPRNIFDDRSAPAHFEFINPPRAVPPPPPAPPGPPADAEFESLPDGWMVPEAANFTNRPDGVRVGLQYSGLYWGSETLAKFPDGKVPSSALDVLAARVEQHGQTNPKRIELFVHPATRFASFNSVVERLDATGAQVYLAVAKDQRLAGALRVVEQASPLINDVLVAHIQTETIEFGVWAFDQEPVWSLVVGRRATDRNGAIGRWRSKQLLEQTDPRTVVSAIVADPEISIAEIVEVYELLRPVGSPLHDLCVSDRRPEERPG